MQSTKNLYTYFIKSHHVPSKKGDVTTNLQFFRCILIPPLWATFQISRILPPKHPNLVTKPCLSEWIQLRLVVEIPLITTGFTNTFQVVSLPDFWTIISSMHDKYAAVIIMKIIIDTVSFSCTRQNELCTLALQKVHVTWNTWNNWFGPWSTAWTYVSRKFAKDNSKCFFAKTPKAAKLRFWWWWWIDRFTMH